MSKFLSTIFTALFVMAFLPLSALAQQSNENGTVKIIITDENRNPFSGNWFLHQGTSIKGHLVRNGSSGEEFSMPAGHYYLEAQRKSSRYPLVWLKSVNPQTLEAGKTLRWELQYFKTQEELDAAKNAPAPAPTSAPTAPASKPEPNPAPKPTPTLLPAKTTTSPAVKRTVSINPNSYKTVPDFNSSPTTSDTTTASHEVVPQSEALVPREAGMQLAQTGNPALLLLVFSGLMGGLAVRKRKH